MGAIKLTSQPTYERLQAVLVSDAAAAEWGAVIHRRVCLVWQMLAHMCALIERNVKPTVQHVPRLIRLVSELYESCGATPRNAYKCSSGQDAACRRVFGSSDIC